jgi:very-short-patch-repair endonuclease
MTEKFTKDEIRNALIKSNGFTSIAAQNLDCHVSTITNYIAKYPELKDTLKEIREKTLDFAESKLLTHINNDNFNALKFFLQTQGKERGYIERQENINVNKQQFDELPSLIDAE